MIAGTKTGNLAQDLLLLIDLDRVDAAIFILVILIGNRGPERFVQP